MEATIEERLSALEKEVAELRASQWLSPAIEKDWRSTVGWAADSVHYDAAVKAGSEIRRSMTYEKEIAEGGGSGY